MSMFHNVQRFVDHANFLCDVIQSEAREYKLQITNDCPAEEMQDLIPVADLLCGWQNN